MDCFSQKVIKGKIVDSTSAAISGAIISIIHPTGNDMIAFATSNDKGEYVIKNDLQNDSVLLSITCFNYEQKDSLVANKDQLLNFTLIYRITMLPEVVIKTQPITISGDTVNYKTINFANRTDRVIGDVLARLPGIEIDEKGRISYNGTSVSNYYIDGLNLLGSQYAIANNNIDFKHVEKIQIIGNDNPIKILDSTKNSNAPSINLKLSAKAKNRLIGKLALGSGFSPLLFDNELLLFQFYKNLQTISGIKYNTRGASLSNELNDNMEIVQNSVVGESNAKTELLSIADLQNPPINQKQLFFNKSFLAYTNILKVLSDSLQVKANVSYFNSQVKAYGTTSTTYFLPSDTIKLTEKKENTIYTKQLLSSFVFLKNTSKAFFKNSTSADILMSQSKGYLQKDDTLHQTLHSPFTKLSNSLEFKKKINEKTYSFSSTINFTTTNQKLSIIPGQFVLQFNQNNPYSLLSQQLKLSNFNTNNAVSFIMRLGKITHEIKIGNEFVNKKLFSALEKTYQQNVYQFNDSFTNRLQLQKIRSYGISEFVIKKRNAQVVITLPLEYNQLKYIAPNKSPLKKDFLFLNPELSLNIPAGSFFELNLNYAVQNKISDINQQYTGYILTNYRTINQNDSVIQQQTLYNYNIKTVFKNALKGFSGYVSLNYSTAKKNTIESIRFNNIFITSENIYLKNNQRNIVAQSSFRKYFLANTFSVSINTSLIWTTAYQLIQTKLSSIKLSSNSGRLQFYYNGSKKYSLESNSIISSTASKIQDDIKVERFYNFSERLKLTLYRGKKISVSLLNEYYKNWSQNLNVQYLFNDLIIKYKYKKLDFDCGVLNIANNQHYISVYLDSRIKYTNDVTIRPRNFFIKCYFNF